MAFRLSIVAGKSEGREFAFDQTVIRIGRQPASDLVLYDTSVSRAHCEILEERGACWLRDLGSSNGTFVNGRAVSKARLREGDRIQIGLVIFAFARRQSGERAPSGDSSAMPPPADFGAQRAVEQQPTDFLPEEVEAAVRRATGGSGRRRRAALQRWYTALPLSTRRTLVASMAVIAAGAMIATGIVAARRRPALDPVQADELFERGLDAFAARADGPENLWRSIEYFEAARAFLERLDPPPARLSRIEAAARRAREELQRLFDSALGRAAELARAGEPEQAAQILRDLSRFFPDHRDERRRRIQERLDELLGPGYTSDRGPLGR